MKKPKTVFRLRIGVNSYSKLLRIKKNTGQSVNSIILIAVEKELVRRSGKYNISPF